MLKINKKFNFQILQFELKTNLPIAFLFCESTGITFIQIYKITAVIKRKLVPLLAISKVLIQQLKQMKKKNKMIMSRIQLITSSNQC